MEPIGEGGMTRGGEPIDGTSDAALGGGAGAITLNFLFLLWPSSTVAFTVNVLFFVCGNVGVGE